MICPSNDRYSSPDLEAKLRQSKLWLNRLADHLVERRRKLLAEKSPLRVRELAQLDHAERKLRAAASLLTW